MHAIETRMLLLNLSSLVANLAEKHSCCLSGFRVYFVLVVVCTL